MARPLEGLRVLAVEQFMAGPLGTMLLADNGAEVIKIERPGVGEISRHVNRFPVGKGGQLVSSTTLRLNRNKKGITLDLKKERGKEIFRELVRVSDAVWENLSAGGMDELGLGYRHLREIKPSLIYVSVSGFGHTDLYPGPYWQRPAYDMVIQAMSGLMYMPGEDEDPPMWLGFQLSDMYPSILAVCGLLMALHMRTKTGLGQHVDMAMYDASVALNERTIALHSLLGQAPARGQGVFTTQLGVFEARDGHLVIGALTQQNWPKLCRTIGREDLLEDQRLATPELRGRYLRELLRPAIEGWTKGNTKDEAVRIFLEQDIPAGPVQRVDDLFQCPQVRARRMLMEVDDPVAGPVLLAGNPIKMSLMEEPPPSPPPLLGQHTQEVLSRLLNLSPAQIEGLRAEGVI